MAATGWLPFLRNAALKSMLLSRSARILAKVDALVSNDVAIDGDGFVSSSASCAKLQGGGVGDGNDGERTWRGRRGVSIVSYLEVKIGNAFS